MRSRDGAPTVAILLTDDQVSSLGGTKTPPVRFTIGGVTVLGRDKRVAAIVDLLRS